MRCLPLIAAMLAALPGAALAQSYVTIQQTGKPAAGAPRASEQDVERAIATKADSTRLDAEISRAQAEKSAATSKSYVDALVRTLGTPAEKLGLACDGVTDDAAKLNTAIAAIQATGGGTILVSARCLLDGADVVVQPGVRVTGITAPSGEQLASLDYTILPATLILNPAHTIQMNGPAALSGLTIIRKGLTHPQSMRDGINAVTAMAGTAITLTGGFDANLSDLMILGFNRAIDSANSARLTLTNVRGDNRNGIRLHDAHDIPRITGAHFWPFLTVHEPWSVTHYTVTAAANNGSGGIRITLSAPHALVTGDQVYAQLPGVLSTFFGTVTVVDATHLDLQGSTFTGALASGGLAIIDTTRRFGTAFEVANSENVQFVNSFSYGYTKGWYLTTGAGWTNLVNCSVDGNYELADPGNIGIAIDGSAYGSSMLGGFISSQAAAIYVATEDGEPHSFTGLSINPSSPAVQGLYIQLKSGRALLVGNHSPAVGPAATISVATTFGGLDLVGNTMPLTSVYLQPGAANRTLISGNTLAARQPLLSLPNNARTSLTTLLTDNGTLQVAGTNVGGCPLFSGTGNPQNSVVAPVCSQYLRLDGGPGSTLYIKESGSGNTGWTAK